MSLRFNGADLRPVLTEARANKCRVALVKDHGVYFLLAYAIGCNPDVDPFDDWWELSRSELGGDDFAEYFALQGVFAHILNNEDDLELSATPTQLPLHAVSRQQGKD